MIKFRDQMAQPKEALSSQEDYLNSQNNRKIETLNREIELLNQRIEHSQKQIDSLRTKDFYYQTQEATLQDKINGNEQAIRTFKQQYQQ